MDPMMAAMILARRADEFQACSALPNAPVVAHVDKVPVLSRTRKSVAAGLRHVADVVAPSGPVRNSTARSARGEAG